MKTLLALILLCPALSFGQVVFNPVNGGAAGFTPNLSSSTASSAISGTFVNTTWACLSSTVSLTITISSSIAAEFHGSMSHSSLAATISLGVLVNGLLIDGETSTAGLISLKEQVATDNNNMSFYETIDPLYLKNGSNTFCLAGFTSASTATIDNTLSIAKFKVTAKP